MFSQDCVQVVRSYIENLPTDRKIGDGKLLALLLKLLPFILPLVMADEAEVDKAIGDGTLIDKLLAFFDDESNIANLATLITALKAWFTKK